MLHPSFFHELLASKGVDFTLGVPDSLLKYYGAYVFDQDNTTIAANEGGSIGIAAGYHFATGKTPLVYMQNSGFGNIVNPLTSLADPEVYSIPMLLMIGWRGEPGVKDEPQHVKQGRVMETLLKALEIPYCVLSKDAEKAKEQMDQAFKVMAEESRPYAILVSAGTFDSYTLQEDELRNRFTLAREEVLEIITRSLSKSDIVVSTTGKTSRELYEIRERDGASHQQDFLTVGSMGHASQIALGIAMGKPNQNVLCIDGDGAVLMHMGALSIIGETKPLNFKHILINNGAHESVGGQPTAGFVTDFCAVAKACGYSQTWQIENKAELQKALPDFMLANGPVMLEIMTSVGSRPDLGRPKTGPIDNKKQFMAFLNNLE